MMFERFTDSARHVVVRAQEDARRLGHNYIGCEHLLLAAIGIDLDVVRARLEAAFGPDALDRAVLAHRRAAQAGRGSRRPAWGKGPVAELMRRRRRRVRRGGLPGLAPRAVTPRFPAPVRGGHIPFTPRAKKSLELSLREATALHDDYIGVQHLILAQLAMSDSMARVILSALGASRESLRAAILARYRKAS
jgi:ATP-dependent Clp protease ATP-binding subunit ClpA